jgi:hypothetical protein
MKLPAFVSGVALLLQTLAPAGPAELQFNWPKDLTARVDTEKTRQRQIGGTSTSTNFKASYRLRASPHPEGLRIGYDDFRIDGAPPAETAAISEMLTSILPTLIVDPQGDFLRVEDIAPLKATVARLVEPLQKTRELRPGVDDLVSRLLTDEVLTNLAGQEWQVLVGAWSALPVTAEKLEVETEEASPVWPGVKFPMKLTVGMIEQGVCSRGGAKINCALFEMRSAVDQAAVKAVMKRLLEGAKDLQGGQFERIDIVTVMRLRLETETMVPHDLSTTKTIEMTATSPQGARTEVKQVERRTSRFSY